MLHMKKFFCLLIMVFSFQLTAFASENSISSENRIVPIQIEQYPDDFSQDVLIEILADVMHPNTSNVISFYLTKENNYYYELEANTFTPIVTIDFENKDDYFVDCRSDFDENGYQQSMSIFIMNKDEMPSFIHDEDDFFDEIDDFDEIKEIDSFNEDEVENLNYLTDWINGFYALLVGLNP